MAASMERATELPTSYTQWKCLESMLRNSLVMLAVTSLLKGGFNLGFVRQSVVKGTFSNSLVVGRDWINEGLLCT